MSESFGRDFRRFFFRGLTVVLPTVLTIGIIVWVFTLIQTYIGRYINVVGKWFLVQGRAISAASGSSSEAAPLTWLEVLLGAERHWAHVDRLWASYHLDWVGFVLAFVAIYILGRFVASFVGRGVWRVVERTFLSMPVVKGIYPSVKQVTDFLLKERKMEFSRVVAVEYPRKGVWSVALVTAPGMRTLQQANEGEYVTLFVPSSPTPVTGYTITVRRDEVIDLPISLDDALRFTVSGGVIMPAVEQLSPTEIKQTKLPGLPPATTKEMSE